MPDKDRTIASSQEVASSLEELKSSYDHLYRDGWMKTHRNFYQTQLMIEKANTGPGLFLDVACGVGYSLDMAEARGARAFGLDLSAVALQHAKNEKRDRRVVQGNGENLPWPSDTFDTIICLGSLEHFIHPDEGAREIARVLKPGGQAAVLLPNSHNLLAIYNVYKTGGILPEQQDFERFGTRVEWESFLNRNGLRVTSVHKFNVGFARVFRKGRGLFWFFYNMLYRLLGDFWIPLNLSYNLIYVCEKKT